jgi:hypothetical protein
MRAKAILSWTFVGGIALLLGFGLSGALGRLLGFGLFVFPALASIFLLLALAMIFGGPIALIVVGIIKRKWEMVAGSVVALSLLAGSCVVSDWVEMRRLTREAQALDMRNFVAPVAEHHLIAMEYSGSPECDRLCQLILVNSDYAVAVGGPSSSWTIYRKIGHTECRATQYVQHNVRYFGICARCETVSQIDDALMIETPSNLSAWNTFPGLGHEYSGVAFALVERQQLHDRVLGRWIAGKVQTSWFHSAPIGEIFTRDAFYRAALGMRLKVEDVQAATWLWEGQAAD